VRACRASPSATACCAGSGASSPEVRSSRARSSIARLERSAREVAEARRARLDAQRDRLRVTSAPAQAKAQRIHLPDKALAHTEPASGPTGQAHVADGIPRSASGQLAAELCERLHAEAQKHLNRAVRTDCGMRSANDILAPLNAPC
jgi:hypothetical protein